LEAVTCCPALRGPLIEQNYIEQRTVDMQPAVVINKAKLPEFEELIHQILLNPNVSGEQMHHEEF